MLTELNELLSESVPENRALSYITPVDFILNLNTITKLFFQNNEARNKTFETQMVFVLQIFGDYGREIVPSFAAPTISELGKWVSEWFNNNNKGE